MNECWGRTNDTNLKRERQKISLINWSLKKITTDNAYRKKKQ